MLAAVLIGDATTIRGSGEIIRSSGRYRVPPLMVGSPQI
jgi:hypothetical protein